MTYDEPTLWDYMDKAKSIYALTKDPLALDAMRVVHEAITDVVTTNDPQHEHSPMQLVVINYLNKMDTARRTLGL